MKSFYSYVALFALLGVGTITTVNAGVFPTNPDGSSILTPNQQVKIAWKDDGKLPKLATLGKIDVSLMTGGDLNQVVLAPIGSPDASTGSLDWVVPEVEPAGKFYFIKFSSAKNDTFFTTRFTITDKNGKSPPEVNPPPAVGKNNGKVGKIIAKGNPNPNGAIGDPKQAPAAPNQSPVTPSQAPVTPNQASVAPVAPNQAPSAPKQTSEAKSKTKVVVRGEPAKTPKGDPKATGNTTTAPSAAASGNKTSSALSINNNSKTIGLTFISLLFSMII